MRTIRASEISAFHYCQRAWWYAQRGEANANLAELSAGSQFHERHARGAFRVRWLQLAGGTFLLLSLVLLVIYLLR